MASFAQTSSPTPFGLFDSDTQFQNDADDMVVFVKRSLGDEILSVEVTKKMCFMAFEQATAKYGALVNEYAALSQIHDLLGLPSGSLLSGSQATYPRETLEFFNRQAEAYSAEIGLGGAFTPISGSITLENGRQDYDIYNELKDSSGTTIAQLIPSGSRGALKILEVHHYAPDTSFLALTTNNANSYLASEFQYESLPRAGGTTYYMLPVFDDLIRVSHSETSLRIRRSHYTYQISGKNIRIFPTPGVNPKKLFMKVMLPMDPLNPSIVDDTIYGASGLASIPFGNLIYSNLNSMAKQWIREYTLAICKEILGWIRSKVETIPMPGGEVRLNGEKLLTDAKEDKLKLMEDLRATLEKFTYSAILEREAGKAENLNKQLAFIPIPKPISAY